MKVLKYGKVNQMPPLWWTEVVHKCGVCGAEWELEKADESIVRIVTERRPNGASVCISTCPTCHADTHTSRRMHEPVLCGVGARTDGE